MLRRSETGMSVFCPLLLQPPSVAAVTAYQAILVQMFGAVPPPPPLTTATFTPLASGTASGCGRRGADCHFPSLKAAGGTSRARRDFALRTVLDGLRKSLCEHCTCQLTRNPFALRIPKRCLVSSNRFATSSGHARALRN